MKKLFALLLTLALVFGLCGCAAAGQPKETSGDGEKIQLTVIVVHEDQKEKIFLYEVDGGMLGDILEQEGLIQSEGADDGMFHTVDGEKADWNEKQSYWAFYIENEYAMTGIYDTPVENGVNYKLVYTVG